MPSTNLASACLLSPIEPTKPRGVLQYGTHFIGGEEEECHLGWSREGAGEGILAGKGKVM